MKEKNKWLIALAGMMLQIAIGSIYAYSVWVDPIIKSNGWDHDQQHWGFSLAICFLGLTAAFMGNFVHKVGPKKAGLIGAVFFTVGLIGAGFASQLNSLPLFYLFYGVVSGIGLGFGYLTPVAVVVQWFPEKPGLASGLVVMSFAIGSMIAAKLIPVFVGGYGVPGAFWILAAIYFVVMVLASLYLANPSAPTGYVDYHAGGEHLSVGTLLKDKRFYVLWLMLFFNSTCGISLIAVAKTLGQTVAHMSNAEAITFVVFIGLFNGLGRLFWSSISDKIGRFATFICFYIIGTVCFFTLTQTTNAFVFQAACCLVISCYGGAFSTIPAYLKDIYGPTKMGSVLGYILLAWSAAAFVGPTLINSTPDTNVIFYLFTGLLIFIAVIAFISRKSLVARAEDVATQH